MEMQINADLSNSYMNEVSKVNYSNSSFNIGFNEELNISLNPNQYETLMLQMFETYKEMYGEKETRNLMQSMEELEVV